MRFPKGKPMTNMAEGTLAPTQITINGQDFSPEEATKFIDLGRKYQEIETKLNTSLDKVYPEYTKSQQRAKELEAELADHTTRLKVYQDREEAVKRTAETPQNVQDARKAARELGLADEDYLKEKGYMTRDEVKEYLTQDKAQQKLVENVLNQAGKLERDIDGSDGRVPFDQKSVLAYASAYNIADLKDAYDQMFERANKPWREAQLAKEERRGLDTLKPGGQKTPPVPKYTNDNIGDAIGEWLNGLPE